MTTEFKYNDPIKRQTEVSKKDRGSELSPMSPPEAYDPPSNIKIEYENLHSSLKLLVDDHTELKKIMLDFEIVLKRLQKNSSLSLELNYEILKFLDCFKQDFSTHNKKEEKYLFPILSQRFLQIGEHSKTKNPITPIDVLEEEHTKATQLVNEVYYIWTTVLKFSDPAARRLLFKDFLIKSLELIEMTRLHIFRENEIVFSLAQKHLTTEELDLIAYNLAKR